MNYEEEQFKLAYGMYIELTNNALEEGLSVHMIAAVMTTIGLSLYRTSLSEEDYDMMIDSITNLKDQVEVFGNDKETIH